MAVTRVCDGGVGTNAAITAITNTGTATLQAGDEVAAVVLIMNASSTGQGWDGFSNYNGTGSANGTAALLDSIAHAGNLRTELWRLTLSATGAAAATWTFNQSLSSNGNIVYAAFNGTDPTTPFVWSKRSNAGDTSIETDSIDPARTGNHVVVAAGAAGYTVAPSDPSHTSADFGSALQNRRAGSATGSWRALSLWGTVLPGDSPTSAYVITDSQASTTSHGWQVLAQPPPPSVQTETLRPTGTSGLQNLTGTVGTEDPDGAITQSGLTGTDPSGVAPNITYQDQADNAGNPTTSTSVTIPSTVQDGDIITVACVNGDGTAQPTISDNSGVGNWTDNTNGGLVRHQAGSAMAGTVWWKRITNATAERGAVVSLSGMTGSTCANLSVRRGCVASGSPIDGTPVSESNASANETQAGITTLTDGASVVLALFFSDNTAAASSYSCTSPGALTQRAQITSSGGSDSGLAVASDIKPTAGATGAFTWAQVDQISVSIAFAIKPQSTAAQTVNTQADVALDNPTGTLETGAATGEIRARIRKKGSGSNPQGRIELRNAAGSWSTTPIADTTITESDADGQLVSGTFDQSIITDKTDVVARFVGTGASGGLAELVAIEWNATVGEGFTSVGQSTDLRWRTYGNVQKDLDSRWRVLSTVQGSLDIRWRVLSTRQKDLDTRWRTYGQVGQSTDLRWRTYARVSLSTDLRWRTYAQVGKSVDLQWRALLAIQKDLDARWRALAAIQKDTDLRWRVEGALTGVQKDLDLRWRVLSTLQKDLDLRWRTYGQVSLSTDLRWRALSTVQKDLEIRWRALLTVQKDLDLRWAVEAVPVSVEIVDSVFSTETADTQTHDVPLPSGSGGLLIGFAAIHGAPTISSVPWGATVLSEVENTVPNTKALIFAKQADGSESASSFSTSVAEQSATHVFRVSGALSSTLPEVLTDIGGSGIQFPDPPNLDPSGDRLEEILWFAAVAYANGTTTVSAYPTDYTAFRNDTSESGSTGSGLATAWRKRSALSEDPGTFTLSTSRSHVAMTVAVRPATEAAPVTKDVDLRWSTSARIATDLELQWKLLTTVQRDVEARWTLLSTTQKDLDVRWRALATIQKSLDVRWRTYVKVLLSADLRWRTLQTVGKSLEIRWKTNARISKDTDLHWRVAAAPGKVSKELDLRWKTNARLSQSLEIRWRLLSTVQKTLDARWRTYASVGKSLEIRWRTFAAIQRDSSLQWRVLRSTSKSLDLRWRLLTTISTDLELQWAIYTALGQDLDLRWSTLAKRSKDIDLRWLVEEVTYTRVARDAELQWIVTGHLWRDIEYRWVAHPYVSEVWAEGEVAPKVYALGRVRKIVAVGELKEKVYATGRVRV